MTMGESDHITFRAGDGGLKDRLDDLSEQYGMKRSAFIRLLLTDAVDIVEQDGLDAYLDDVEPEEQAAD
ncbi:hypothetical protein EGH26_20255 [Halomicroarcula pellucida]|uniref:hypothetical protein n=1 Tax=Haloarcula pellucida TaxID=1427151 RepID=UPI001C73812F|nr:hypothetical protein [Halomicroarcula pellucida]MBX0350523.1 hypothetical protein [Halomicroarcula pellucida]